MASIQQNQPQTTKAEAIESMLKTLTMLSSEVIEKRAEMERVKANIKQGKNKYNTEIKKYSSLTKQIIKLEEEIEVIETQNAKKKIAQHLIIINITKDFFKNCVDSFPQIQSDVYRVLLKVCGFENDYHQNEFRIFNTVIKDENELKALIENVDKVQLDYYLQNEPLFISIKMEMAINPLQEIQYPFDVFFEYFRLVYEIILNNQEKMILINQIDEKNDIKNQTFLGLKELESEIMSNDETYHSLSNHIKGINSLLNSYKQLKANNSSSEAILLFASKVKEFKHFTYNPLVKYDIMNSLTIQSEYSEDKSELSSITEMKMNKDNKSAINSITSTSALMKQKNACTSSKDVVKNQSIKKAGTKASLNKSNSNIINEQGLSNPSFSSVMSPIKRHSNINNGINKAKSKPNDIKTKSRSEMISHQSKNDNNSNQKKQSLQDELLIPMSPMIDMNSVKDIDSVCDEIEDTFPIKNMSLKNAKKFTYFSAQIINGNGNLNGNGNYGNGNISGRKRVLKEMPFLRFEKPVNSSDCCVACT